MEHNTFPFTPIARSYVLLRNYNKIGLHPGMNLPFVGLLKHRTHSHCWTQDVERRQLTSDKLSTNTHQIHTQTQVMLSYNNKTWSSGVHEHSTRHTNGHPSVQCTFKILMIHEVLQFALRIAFRCVLHRCGSLDIRC